jgi:hypothetical protein
MEFVRAFLERLFRRAGPEFVEGQKTGEAYAKRDASRDFSRGLRPPCNADASLKARSYTQSFKAEGKSKQFVRGFHWGYTQKYEEMISTYGGA